MKKWFYCAKFMPVRIAFWDTLVIFTGEDDIIDLISKKFGQDSKLSDFECYELSSDGQKIERKDLVIAGYRVAFLTDKTVERLLDQLPRDSKNLIMNSEQRDLIEMVLIHEIQDLRLFFLGTGIDSKEWPRIASIRIITYVVSKRAKVITA